MWALITTWHSSLSSLLIFHFLKEKNLLLWNQWTEYVKKLGDNHPWHVYSQNCICCGPLLKNMATVTKNGTYGVSLYISVYISKAKIERGNLRCLTFFGWKRFIFPENFKIINVLMLELRFFWANFTFFAYYLENKRRMIIIVNW